MAIYNTDEDPNVTMWNRQNEKEMNNSNKTTRELAPDFIADNAQPDGFTVTKINDAEYMGERYGWSSNAKGWFKITRHSKTDQPLPTIKEEDELRKENKQLKEENERMKEALQDMMEGSEEDPTVPGNWWQRMTPTTKALNKAKEALQANNLK